MSQSVWSILQNEPLFWPRTPLSEFDALESLNAPLHVGHWGFSGFRSTASLLPFCCGCLSTSSRQGSFCRGETEAEPLSRAYMAGYQRLFPVPPKCGGHKYFILLNRLSPAPSSSENLKQTVLDTRYPAFICSGFGLCS